MDRSVPTQVSQSDSPDAPPRESWLYDPKVRGAAYQVALVVVILFVGWMAATNAVENLRRAGIAAGFGFWNVTAGFDVSQSLIRSAPPARPTARPSWSGCSIRCSSRRSASCWRPSSGS